MTAVPKRQVLERGISNVIVLMESIPIEPKRWEYKSENATASDMMSLVWFSTIQQIRACLLSIEIMFWLKYIMN